MAGTKPAAKKDALLVKFLSSRIMQMFAILLAVSFVILFYSFATSGEDFLTQSHALYDAERKSVHGKSDKLKTQRKLEDETINDKQVDAAKKQAMKHAREFANDFHILFIFAKVKNNPKLKGKFSVAFDSLFEHAKFNENETLHLHFVCDEEGRKFADEFLQKQVAHPEFSLKVHFHSVSSVVKQLPREIVKMREKLGQDNPYYDDSIFFISLALHKILPDHIHRVVQLDLDLKFTVNIRDIWNEFSYFSRDNMIGIANENQPVYRHILWKYRQENPTTDFGNPAPNGKPGFNSGVILLHLDHLRTSYTYNSYLDANVVNDLVKKFSFKGHLGDQDFFTLLSFEHPQLFFVLDCSWNKQLCEWWRNKGYENIFDKYFQCSGDIKIWHGNCDTAIP